MINKRAGRYLIIGNSAAGVKAAEIIRRKDPQGSITIVTEESYPSYARPRLTDYIPGQLAERGLWNVGRSFYARNGIHLLLGTKVLKVDLKESKIFCADGATVPYDRLLIAVGAIPNRLTCPGVDLIGVTTLRTVADAILIRERLRTTREVVVIGGGLLGIDLAQAFVERQLKVTLLVREDRLGVPTLDPEAGKIVETRLREHGVDVSLNEEVAEFLGAGWELSAVLTSKGRTIPCQLAAVSIGVKPNIGFLRDSGLEIDRGILVDSFMRSSVENIFAAGDVAQLRGGPDKPAGVQTSWFNATAQGIVAGQNMAGGHVEYRDPPFNYIDVFESGVSTFGETRLQNFYEILKTVDMPNKKYRRLSLKDNKLVGGIVIDGVAQVQEFVLLTKLGFDVSEFKDKLLDPTFSPVEALRKKQKQAAEMGQPIEGQIIHKMRCKRCGYIMIGEIPENCPLCGASKEEFEPVD